MKLEEFEVFDTGLKHRGKPVTVGLQPAKGGGILIFKCGMKRRRVPLAQILTNLLQPDYEGTTDEDMVNLGALESKIATMALNAETDEEEKAIYKAKTKLLRVVRNMRDDAREEAGMPPVTYRWKGGGDE